MYFNFLFHMALLNGIVYAKNTFCRMFDFISNELVDIESTDCALLLVSTSTYTSLRE